MSLDSSYKHFINAYIQASVTTTWLVWSPVSCAVSDPSAKTDDGAYDIITEEDANGIYDSDSLSLTTGDSLEGEQDTRPLGALEMWVQPDMDRYLAK